MKYFYHTLILCIAIVIVFLVYKDLFQTFYQQDEWNTLGNIQAGGARAILHGQSPLELVGGGGRPLSFPIHYFIYTNYPLQIEPFIYFAIFFHALNAFLLYIFAKLLTKNVFIAGIATLFFIFSSTSHQAVTWISATTTTLPSVTFSLLSLIAYLFFLKTKKTMFIYMSVTLTTVAFFFKESSIFIFVLFPLLYFLYSENKPSIRRILRVHWIFVLPALVAISSRIYALFFINQGLTTGFVTRNEFALQKLLLHVFTFPISSFSQLYIYPGQMWPVANMLNILNYPRISSETFAIVVVETIGAEAISVFLSILFLLVFYFMHKKLREYRRPLIFSLIFIFLSFIPYAILDKSTAYLESRYFYPGEVGAALLFAFVIYYIFTIFVTRFPKFKHVILVCLAILVSLYFLMQIEIIRTDIKQQIEISGERKELINDLKKYDPAISKKTVYYMSGNRDYFVEGNKLPFAQGMGYTLMVLYNHSDLIPKDFLKDNFLWNLREEGYAEDNGKGFGYYSTLSTLSYDVFGEKVDLDNIIGLFYDADKRKLIDITEEIKKEVEASLSATIRP